MRPFIVLLAVAAGCAQGSIFGGDSAVAFVGLWSGTISSGSVAQAATMPIIRTGFNQILLQNVCGDGTGPTAAVTSATTFTISRLACATGPVSGCSSATLAIDGGSGALSNGTLAMRLDTHLTGCGQNYNLSFSFSGTRGASEPAVPVASLSAQPAGVVPLHTQVNLDASASSDPHRLPLQYQWQLVPPSGSAAALSFSSSSRVSFTPDLAGAYVVWLTVSNGTQSSAPVSLTVIAGSSLLVASLRPSVDAVRGETVSLDASGSADSQRRPIQFSWTLLSAPPGSAATLSDATAAVAHLLPDLDGAYAVQVQVSAGADTATATTTVLVHPPLLPLAFRPVDAKYSRALDRIVAVAASPDALHLLDPVTLNDVSIPLPLAARCLGISQDGLYAAVGHDAWVSYVDLAGAKVIRTWPLGADAGDVVLGNEVTVNASTTRFAYVFPRRDQWVAIHLLDLGTGVETTYGLVYAGMRAVLQPGSGHIFGVTAGLSPAQIYRFDTGSDGAFIGSGGSPYWGDYAMGARLWMSDDGQQLLTAAATRFRTSDLTYAGTAAPTVTGYLASADWSTPAGRWLVQPGDNGYSYGTTTPPDGSFWTVDAQYLASPIETRYPPFVHGGQSYALHGRYVFFDSSGLRHVALAEVDASASLLQNYVVLSL
jgi:chitinase